MPSRLVLDPRDDSQGVYTPLAIIGCPVHMCRGHAMTPRGVYNPLGVMVFPLE